MECITDFEQLNTFISTSLKKGTHTNCYLMSSDYHRYIEAGQLFYHRTAAGQFILCGFPEYYRLYYCLTDLSQPSPIPKDKPVVMEIVYQGADKKPESIIDYWKSQGFSSHIQRERMAASGSDFTGSSHDDVEFASTNSDIDFIHNMLMHSFDRYTACIPTKDELSRMIDEKQMLCILNENRRLEGILHFAVNRSVSVLWHLVVAENARGRGTASKLLSHWRALDHSNHISSYRLWVMEDNMPAKRLYTKNGFRFDGYRSISMILNK